MAHQTRTREDETAWSTGALTPTELDHIDQKTFQSINGDEGGVWAPTEVIIIGGEGLEVSGPFLSSNEANFTGANFIVQCGTIELGDSSADGLIVSATTEFLNDVTVGTSDADTLFIFSNVEGNNASFQGDVSLGIDALDVTNIQTLIVNETAEFVGQVQFDDDVIAALDLTVEGNLVVEGDTQLGTLSTDTITILGVLEAEADVTIGTGTGDDLLVRSTSVFEGPITVEDDFELQSVMTFNGIGRVPLRYRLADDASETIDVTMANVSRVASLTDTRTYILDDTGAVPGDFMLFFTPSGGASANWSVDPAGAGQTFTATNGSTHAWVLYVRISSAWAVVFYSGGGI